jgi:hypothetical protein
MHIMNINLNNSLLSLFFISFRKLPKTETDTDWTDNSGNYYY